MELSMQDLKYKEVISVVDGNRFGYVGDVALDPESGQIKALIIYGRCRLFGLFGRVEDYRIPWDAIQRFGQDIILVELSPLRFQQGKESQMTVREKSLRG